MAELTASLRDLRESLAGFRQDLEEHWAIKRRLDANYQRLQTLGHTTLDSPRGRLDDGCATPDSDGKHRPRDLGELVSMVRSAAGKPEFSHIRAEPTPPPELAGSFHRHLHGFSPKSARNELIAQLEIHPQADLYADLADELQDDEEVEINGETCSQRMLFLKALNLDPNFARGYSDLGCVIGSQGVRLFGQDMTERDLYIRALELDPRMGLTYLNLRDVLRADESVWIGGVEYDADSLTAKAAELEKNLP
eukprot:CAMPEP_0194544432 /NCGR_PEP_ID=MMETSP0253-20130528/87561_1 /TAXON_ID=2966 /ORGANISM="Noctiluca scintillans" /LENGTH=250 /DNA_ID=CAMNT_0039391321 /DNA_START=19 /DNA_END=771 /DNA_ORIENTATION=-